MKNWKEAKITRVENGYIVSDGARTASLERPIYVFTRLYAAYQFLEEKFGGDNE